MASRIFHDLLLQRHDALSRFERQAFWVVVLVVCVHLIVFTPLLSAWHQARQATTEAQRLADIGPGLDALIEDLDGLRVDYLAVLQPALDEQVRGLVLDLDRLEASRWQWQQPAPEAEDSLEPTGSQLDPSLVMSEPPQGAVPLPIEEPLLSELRQAKNRYALLTLLEPWVEEQIIRPRLQALQHTWETEAHPIIGARLNTVGDAVSTWRARLPEAKESWDAVSATLTSMAAAAEGWTAQPPSQPFWWASPESEPRLALGLGSHTEILSRPPALARLAVQQQELQHRLSEVVGVWKRQWQDVPSKEIAATGGVSSWFPEAMPWVPATSGLILALLIWGHARTSRQLLSAVNRAISLGSPQALVPWCGARVSGRQGTGTLESGLGRQFFIQSMAALLWVGGVAYQVLGQPETDWAPWTPTSIAVLLVVLAASYRLVSLRQGLRQLKTHLPTNGESEIPTEQVHSDGTEQDDNPVEMDLRR